MSQYIKEEALDASKTRSIVSFLGLSSIAIVVPFFLHLQWATGPMVNAILILVLFLVGIRSSLMLCMIPSVMALVGGLLPVVLAPAIPFIMISNAIFVVTIDWFYKNLKDQMTGYWVGVVLGSALKFVFLLLSVQFITKLIVKQELAVKVAQMMSWPQFATAITGGMIAFLILKWLRRI